MRQPDGRSVYLYGAHGEPPTGYRAPLLAEGVYERRWHPLRQEWILVAAGRQGRTFLPAKNACPLCPSTSDRHTEVPADRFDVAVFENRFPAMLDGNGVCEVVVYCQQHDSSFGSLERDSLEQLMGAWTNRYCELGARRDVRYVYIFENRGEAVGVTLHHPHGQIYAYPFIPPTIEAELQATRAHARKGKGCLQCDLIADERRAEDRMLFERGGIAAYVPAYARFPAEVHVAPILHAGALPDLSQDARLDLGEALQAVARAYDRRFQVPMPYMMAMHQRPTDGRPHPDAHLHVEFYPLLRDSRRLKYLAAGECGTGTFVSDNLPEEAAAELRKALDA